MRRVNPYKPQYGGDATVFVILLLLCLAVAIVLAMAALSPQMNSLPPLGTIPSSGR
jgi:hypothetical protein